MNGGLREHSDLDLLLLVTQPVPDEARAGLTSDFLRISGVPGGTGGRPLEVTIVQLDQVQPWRYPPVCEYQFGEWLRPDLEAGFSIRPGTDPDLAVLMTTTRQHSWPVLGPAAAKLIDPVPRKDLLSAMSATLPELVSSWQGDERNALLTLSRMLVTAVTGKILAKDQAAGWVLSRYPGAHQAMLSHARAEYLGDARHVWPDMREQVKIAIDSLGELIEAALRRSTDR